MARRGSKWGTLNDRESNVYQPIKIGQRTAKQLLFQDFNDQKDKVIKQQHLQLLYTLHETDRANLSTDQITGLIEAHTNGDWKVRPEIAPFELAILRKDMKTLRVLSTVFFSSPRHLDWTPEQFDKFVIEVLLTNDFKIYELVFFTQVFVFQKLQMICEKLAQMYRDSDSNAKLARFYSIFTFFLDIGGNHIMHDIQSFFRVMVPRGDIELMRIMLDHEASFNQFLQDPPIYYFLFMGDATVPFVEMAVKDMPQQLEFSLQYGAWANQTALVRAAGSGQEGLVRCLVALGGTSQLQQAIEVARTDTIKAILNSATAVPSQLTPEAGTGSSRALKRIMRDWREVMADPPSNSVRAFPNEADMFKWHVVLTAPSHKHPLRGVNFHFVMTFPNDYPDNPPYIEGSQYLPHPNYFNGFICLDMLRSDSYSYYGKEYGGWSSGYSALSILMQLQSFLFSEEVDQDHGFSVTNDYKSHQIHKAYSECINFKCETCGFNHTFKGFELPASAFPKKMLDEQLTKKLEAINKLPFLSLPKYSRIQDPSKKKPKKSAIQTLLTTSLIDLPDDMILHILDFLTRSEDLIAVLRVNKHLHNIEVRHSVWRRRELICFYSKVSFTDDILGIGIHVKRGNGGRIETISSPLDMLSKTAFLQNGIRASVWREPINYWLPLIIDKKHGALALPYLKAGIVAILLGASFDIHNSRRGYNNKLQALNIEAAEHKLAELAERFHPLMVLDVIPKLMNQCVVSMMQESDKKSKVASQHNSEKALLGYTLYHHMLLALCAWFPEVQQRIDYVLEQFLRHESARVKLVQPDLGELLVYLSVSSRITWQQIGPAFLQEQLERSVVWMLDDKTGKGHGELAYLEKSAVSDYRLKVSLESSITGKRLLMFQVFFLENIGRPSGRTPIDILRRLNASYGAPPAGAATLLQKESNKIYYVRTWESFFARVSLPCPSKQEITTMLRQAVINSEKKGYHVNRLSEEELYNWRLKTDRSIRGGPDLETFPETSALKSGPKKSRKGRTVQNKQISPPQNGQTTLQNDQTTSQNDQITSKATSQNGQTPPQNTQILPQNGKNPPQNSQTPQKEQIPWKDIVSQTLPQSQKSQKGHTPRKEKFPAPNCHTAQNTPMPAQNNPIPSQNEQILKNNQIAWKDIVSSPATLPQSAKSPTQNNPTPPQNDQKLSQNGLIPENDQIARKEAVPSTNTPTAPSQNSQMPLQNSPISSQNNQVLSKNNLITSNTTESPLLTPNLTNCNSTEQNHHTLPGNYKSNTPLCAPVKIFVGNLSYRVTALDLEFVFQQFGKLVSSEVVCDMNDQSRGFGFIEVENEDIASTLLDFMQGAEVDRRPIRLERVINRIR